MGVTTPLKFKPPTGRTFVYLQCDASQCADIAHGVQAAVQAVGWNLKILQYNQSDPSTLIDAMNLALQYKPVAVSFVGLPEAVWQNEIPVYKKAGVSLIPAYVGDVTPDPPVILANLGDLTYSITNGKNVADWFIADSNGTGHALLVNVSSFPTLNAFSQSFISEVSRLCPKCSVTTTDETYPQVTNGQTNSLIVSQLRRDTSLDYVVNSSAAFMDGIAEALQAAGLAGKVKVAGQSGDIANLAGVLAGTENAFTAIPDYYIGWLMIDASLRHVEGMPVPFTDGGTPTQLLTKANMGTPSQSHDPVDYQSKFEKLWLVNS